MNLPIPDDLAQLLRTVPELSRSYLVGGCVRDAILGRPVKDFDIEVFGIDEDRLADALARHGRLDRVGRSFGVLKLSLGGAVHDFSLPRRDVKTGPGHRGFTATVEPAFSLAEAAARRDFTINALMWDPRTAVLHDFFGGLSDLNDRCLRHTSPAFIEDPLRVLRGMQFAGRFDLQAAPETLALCRSIVGGFGELAVERIREEWFKWAAQSIRPSAGLRFLAATDWIRHFPELGAIRDVPQDPQWHPEGDVFTHTCHTLDALVGLPAWQEADPASRSVLTLAVLTHDFGKATTTRIVNADDRRRIISPGHDQESGILAEAFLARLRTPIAITDRVLPLVRNHMVHFQEVNARAIRRLARRLEPETVERLCIVMTADAMGRPPRPATTPETVHRLRQLAAELSLADAAPRPVLLGRHFLTLGLPPGPEVGRWVAQAFEAQLDGGFHDLPGAWSWLACQPTLPETLRAQARRHAAAAVPSIQPRDGPTAPQNGASSSSTASAEPGAAR